MLPQYLEAVKLVENNRSNYFDFEECMTMLKSREADFKIDEDGNIISSNVGFDLKRIATNKYKIALNKDNTIVYVILWNSLCNFTFLC